MLPLFPPRLSARAAGALEGLGVTPLVETTVVDIDEESVSIADGAGDERANPGTTVVWAAGVVASGIAAALAAEAGAELDRPGASRSGRT